MKAAFFGLVALAGIVCSQEQDKVSDPMTSFAVSSKFAYFMAPAKLISDGDLDRIAFSTDGKFAILHGFNRGKRPPEMFIKWLETGVSPVSEPEFNRVWSVETGTVRDLSPEVAALISRPRTSDGFVQWTSKPGIAVVGSYESGLVEQELHYRRVNIIDGSIREIKSLATAAETQLMVSPARPIIVAISETFTNPVDKIGVKSTVTFSITDLEGNVLKSGKQILLGRAAFFDWTTDGQHVLGRSSLKTAPGVKPKFSVIVLNTSNGTISETQEEIEGFGDDIKESELTTETVNSKVDFGGSTRIVQSLWLAPVGNGEIKPALVAGEVDQDTWLSPDLKTVAFTLDGRLYAREIAKIDLDTYKKAMAEAQRRAALVRVKQIALAINIYSTDTDDVFPLANNFEEAIYPYIRSKDHLSGFVYLLNGQASTSFDRPANTELGYISVPGGRVVVYVDTHAKFVPNP